MHFVRDCTKLWNFFVRLKIGQWNLHTLPQQAEGLRTVIQLRWISRSIRRAPTSYNFIHFSGKFLQTQNCNSKRLLQICTFFDTKKTDFQTIISLHCGSSIKYWQDLTIERSFALHISSVHVVYSNFYLIFYPNFKISKKSDTQIW